MFPTRSVYAKIQIMKNAASALRALGDDTRRQIFNGLATGPRSVSDIAAGLTVTRPAVSQHLKVLTEAGLIKGRSEGRTRIYQIDPNGLAAVRMWLDQHWARAFVAFNEFAQEAAGSPGQEDSVSGGPKEAR